MADVQNSQALIIFQNCQRLNRATFKQLRYVTAHPKRRVEVKVTILITEEREVTKPRILIY